MSIDLIEFLSKTPAEVVTELPVVTSSVDLPFEKLTWENFERFCFQLGSFSMKCLETSYIYGRKGQNQEGIDIYFNDNGKRILWQIKRYNNPFKAKDIDDAVEIFLKSKWKENVDTFTLCVSKYLDDVNVVNAIDEKTEQLSNLGITFCVNNSQKLTIMTKEYPQIVADFFGEHWLKALGIKSVCSYNQTLMQIIYEIQDNEQVIKLIQDYFLANNLKEIVLYPEEQKEWWIFIDETPARSVRCEGSKGIHSLKPYIKHKDEISLIQDTEIRKDISEIYKCFEIYHLANGFDRNFAIETYNKLKHFLTKYEGIL